MKGEFQERRNNALKGMKRLMSASRMVGKGRRECIRNKGAKNRLTAYLST